MRIAQTESGFLHMWPWWQRCHSCLLMKLCKCWIPRISQRVPRRLWQKPFPSLLPTSTFFEALKTIVHAPWNGCLNVIWGSPPAETNSHLLFLVDAGRVCQSEVVGNDPSRTMATTYPIRIVPNSEVCVCWSEVMDKMESARGKPRDRKNDNKDMDHTSSGTKYIMLEQMAVRFSWQGKGTRFDNKYHILIYSTACDLTKMVVPQ